MNRERRSVCKTPAQAGGTPRIGSLNEGPARGMWARRLYPISPTKLCRILHHLTEVSFLAGCFWLGLLVVSCILGNRTATERGDALLVGLCLMVPAPMLLIGERIFSCCSHAGRMDDDGQAIPSPRRRRDQRENAGSPRSPPLPFLEFDDVHWWADRPPTYEEALRLPKLDDMAPAIHQTGRPAVLSNMT